MLALRRTDGGSDQNYRILLRRRVAVSQAWPRVELSGMDFILTPGYAINPRRIDFVRFLKDGSVIIHVGGSALTFDGEAAKTLREDITDDDFSFGPKVPSPEPPDPTPEPDPAPAAPEK